MANPSYNGTEEGFRDLERVQAQAEHSYMSRLKIKEPTPLLSKKPGYLEEKFQGCLSAITPPCLEDFTFQDCYNFSGPVIVVLTSLFLVGILPWIPMLLENTRSCESFVPETGILGLGAGNDETASGGSLFVSEHLMNFDKNRTIRPLRSYSSMLYTAEVSEGQDVTEEEEGALAILAHYFGDKNELRFQEMDPACSDEALAEPPAASTNATGDIRFCMSPFDDVIIGGERNNLGDPPVFQVLSPSIPGLHVNVSVRLRKRLIQFPDVTFSFFNLNDPDSSEPVVEIKYISSKNSRPYVRRANFEHGGILTFDTTESDGEEEAEEVISEDPILWLGAYSPVLGVGDHDTSSKIEGLPENSSDFGKVHRLCVPALAGQGSLTDTGSLVSIETLVAEAMDENATIDVDVLLANPEDLIKAMLLSPDLSAKVGFHIRTVTLYRADTAVTIVFKVSLLVICVMIIANGALFFFDED